MGGAVPHLNKNPLECISAKELLSALPFMSPPPLQLAEVKVRILEAKQTLEDCITAQEFSRAAELKDSITELENRRNRIIQEIAESTQPADKEVRTEKVNDHTGSTATCH